jgi:ribonuclease P protein component
VKRTFRLTRSTEFKRVRRSGKSFAHPLIVLIADASEQQQTRVGVTASRSLGGAVQRNRAKRRLREAMRPLLGDLRDGWNLILLARKPLLEAKLPQIESALTQLLQRSNLLERPDDQNHPS